MLDASISGVAAAADRMKLAAVVVVVVRIENSCLRCLHLSGTREQATAASVDEEASDASRAGVAATPAAAAATVLWWRGKALEESLGSEATTASSRLPSSLDPDDSASIVTQHDSLLRSTQSSPAIAVASVTDPDLGCKGRIA